MAKIGKAVALTVKETAAVETLNGIRKAAAAAGKRMQALEAQAEEIHARTMQTCTARIVSGPDGVHALIRDSHGVTVEISGGNVALAVAKE
jgi:hypothetical protein